MIKIRLARYGKTNDPHYRIVAIDHLKKREGEPVEVLGHWHPRKDEKKIDKKKIESWLEKGAQLSKGVKSLLEGKKPKKAKKAKKTKKDKEDKNDKSKKKDKKDEKKDKKGDK